MTEIVAVDIGGTHARFAIAEIGGAWLVWQGVREHKGWIWIGAGIIALGLAVALTRTAV